MDNMDSENTSDMDVDQKRKAIDDVVRARVQHLRARLLDSSRRNPLIQVPFRKNSSSLIRVVDELPDVLAERLANQKSMRLVSLPPIDEPLPDEQTDAFLDAFEIARTTDEEYLAASADLDPTDTEYAQKEVDLERALKDRVRNELGLPERQTEENPSLAAHARNHGISPEYILPDPLSVHDDGRHEDADIQTLLLPDRLERVGRSLHDRGHAFERETGVNVLHAAFGVLEWKEPGSSRDPARSPLLLLEVRISRKKAPAGAEYHVCGENELALNTTLAQSFSAQFGLNLPLYEGGSIEDYFQKVADLSPPGWGWNLRREALIGVFPSSRIAMHRDLDPDTPGITDNPVIEAMLATTGGDAASYAEVYDTDDPEVERAVPHLIMDADASQFSSLVDVANGQNVAIEGPPGSGKSQTIVNLIASAIAGGKKVLFVAEKLTALDVVRNRLDAAGLGEFVLPLQAGRGSRDAVFQSLEDRINMERPVHGSAKAHKERQYALINRRSKMQSYLDMLGTTVGQTEMTVHKVFGRAIATAQHLDDLPRDIRKLRLPLADRLTPEALATLEGDIRMVVERLNSADDIATLWQEAQQAPIRNDEAENIALDLTTLARGILALRSEIRDSPLRDLLPEDILEADEAAITSALNAIAGNTDSDADLVALFLDQELRSAAHDYCNARDEEAVCERTLKDILTDPHAQDAEEKINTAAELAARSDYKIDPAALAARVSGLEAQERRLLEQRDLTKALPARWAETASQDGITLSELRLDAEMLLRAPQTVLDRRLPDDGRSIPTIAREAANTYRQLTGDLETLRRKLPGAGKHDVSTLEQTASTIESAGFFRFLSGSYKSACAFLRDDIGANLGGDREAAALALRDYAKWAERRDSFTNDSRMTAALGQAFKGMDSDPCLLHDLASFHETTNRISRGDERLRYVLETGDLTPLRTFAQDKDMPSETLHALEERIARLDHELKDARSDLELGRSLCLSFLRREVVEAELILEAQQAQRNLQEAKRASASSKAHDLLSERTDMTGIRTAILIADRVEKLPHPGKGIDLLREGEPQGILSRAENFFKKLNALTSEADAVVAEIDLPCPEGALRTLSKRLGDIQSAAKHPEGLVERARLLRAITAMEECGLSDLAAWIQTPEGAAHREALPDIFAAIFARSLTDHVETIHGRELDAQDGADLDRLRGDIAKIDRELTSLSRRAIQEDLLLNSRPPKGNGTRPVKNFTEMSLISHELNKVRNRVGVRELTNRAGGALIDLKPCWMMSPLAVAQYLSSDFVFDLVVIDEASQMTPENALGAIKRARQVVVVGDTKQLPPTNFFSKIIDDSDEDEDARTDSESILDMANATFTPVRQLRWHYRSRHPNLIAISNKMIYDEKLTIFPAARDGDPSLGVELVEVEGEYRKGRNIPEARQIVAGAIAHMRDHPERSLGLATMNKDQTELILSEFERERSRHPHVEAYIERWAEKDDGLEEFFVKNLETIQGDERDVIMISTLYGPDAQTGKVYQRFGPVNSVHGHRRLNVLFSRAKEKIVTYSSMKPADIQAEGKAYGVAMLRAWLEFSRTGQINEIQSQQAQTDSPFEDFVITQIEAAGFEAVPQVGASGYRIDIGVRHPDWPYGFILAVECDGAPYHSSRSSRDRDRLRQQVLEGLGWHFHRIWSTDWFRDPRTQIARLRKALEEALQRAKREETERQEARARAAERAQQEAEAAVRRAEEEAEAAAKVAEEKAKRLPDENPNQGTLFEIAQSSSSNQAQSRQE